MNAVLPALRARGRAALVFTSSLPGLTAVPGDPIYAATRHAIIGLARALGPALAADHIAVNAPCPGIAYTAISEPVRHLISAARIPLMTADAVADALVAILASHRTGEAWYVQPGRPADPSPSGTSRDPVPPGLPDRRSPLDALTARLDERGAFLHPASRDRRGDARAGGGPRDRVWSSKVCTRWLGPRSLRHAVSDGQDAYKIEVTGRPTA